MHDVLMILSPWFIIVLMLCADMHSSTCAAYRRLRKFLTTKTTKKVLVHALVT